MHFFRSSQRTAISSLFAFASFSSCVMTPVCSITPGIPGTPPFCTDVSIYVFFKRKSTNRRFKRLKKIFPSTFSSDMHLNWFIFFAPSSFGIQMPWEYFHCPTTFPLLHIILNNFNRNRRSRGHRLYTT